jgi:hypothetical protein
MVVLLVVLTTADRLVCPDGCTDEASHSEVSGPQRCGLCQGWSGPTAALFTEPSARVTPRTFLSDPAARAAFLPAIEHPPRIA